MKKDPLLTICVPAYNSGRFFKKTLQSIAEQDYPNFEIIVLDNASEDNTLKIAESFGDKRIRTCKNAINVGNPYNNCNRHMKDIKGEFVAFYHSDDIYEKSIARKEVEFLAANPETAAVFTLGNMIDQNDKISGKFKLPRDLRGKTVYNFMEIFNDILKYGNMFLITPTFMTRTSVFDKVGLFNESDFGSAQDLEMWLRIATKYPIGILPENLINYRLGGGGKIYQRSRTKRSDHFLVMDHYLEKVKTSIKIEDKFLRQYECQKNFDDTMLAMNFLMKNDIESAKKLINKPFSFNNLRAFLENITLLRIKILILKFIMLICVNIGLGRYLGHLLRRII